MNTTPALSAAGLGMRYGSKHVLDGLDLEVRRGEILALLGANGAGKTTLLSILTGLRRPGAGQVRVFGQDPQETAARGLIGVMLQDCELPPSLRVGELIELFRRLYAQPLPMDEILRLAGLEGLQSRDVAKLSGGQKQRVKFALAVAGDPPLLFLDEPTVAMDAESRRRFLAALRERVARGCSIVLTTHHLEEVDAVADRIAVLHGGAILSCGSPAQIKASMGGKLLRFHSDAATEGGLRSIPGVTQVAQGDGHWCVQTSQPEDSLRALLGGIHDVRDISVRAFGLEEALSNLTAAAEQRVYQ
ncbi:ABC transporter ATP-binding protein [Ramlibacter sp.]|uniref:ABC transporter ATP-binding protein n=1 Tax=Ramlibacter sp. TaxID=1917967 RepID=UPI0017FA3FB4|nr:ABC transporter ATP-binding protein [Ramlibacter sp.]MBA2674446.1 ABC transporter ATP-binding protein [Ramlibacter sp.]